MTNQSVKVFMPPRDEQDFEGRRQQIIDGALQVFASKGFEKATNKDIAAASGIGSPGLIYHYFKDKSDLFRQVVEQRLPVLQLLTNSEEIMTKPPQGALTLFGMVFLKVAENPTSIALMNPNFHNLKVGITDYSNSRTSREIIEVFDGTDAFVISQYYPSKQPMTADLARRVVWSLQPHLHHAQLCAMAQLSESLALLCPGSVAGYCSREWALRLCGLKC